MIVGTGKGWDGMGWEEKRDRDQGSGEVGNLGPMTEWVSHLTSIKLSYTTVLSYQSSFMSGNHQNDISSNVQIDIHIPYSDLDSDSDSRDWDEYINTPSTELSVSVYDIISNIISNIKYHIKVDGDTHVT